MANLSPHRPEPAGLIRGVVAVLFNDELTRGMAALALSLAIMVGVTNLPFHGLPQAIGWSYSPDAEPLRIDLLETREPLHAQKAIEAPATRHTPAEKQRLDDAPTPDDEEPLPEITADASLTSLPQRIRPRQAVLEYSEQMPEIVGGLGAYYLNIEYPAKALAAGIQGRLTLEFVVETDGSVSRVDVAQSLHPLCDSAAVAALRRSRFVPGRQQGEAVRVRMRLPVRFVLRNRTPDAIATDTTKAI